MQADLKWHTRYLKLAKEVAGWSKDPSTQVGAVAIGSRGQVLSQGYNGFPRGIIDTRERYNDRDVKYKFIVHAEMNCIYNATLNGVSLNGATLYIFGLPLCSECSKGVIQVGINTVVMPQIVIPEKWQKSWELSAKMLTEAGVNFQFVNYELNQNT
jgi:dCMP deaminase